MGMTKESSETAAGVVVGALGRTESSLTPSSTSTSTSSFASSAAAAASILSDGGFSLFSSNTSTPDDNYDLSENNRREMSSSSMTTMNSIFWLPDGNFTTHNNLSSEPIVIDEFPYFIRVTSTLLCGFILLIGIIGNILVPVVVWRNKDLRSSTNIFLINLSLADLLILLVCMPPVLIELHSKPEVWVLGAAMCKSFFLIFLWSLKCYQQ